MRIKGRVLFIGKDTEISNLVVKVLTRQGCQATSTGQDNALLLLSKNDYDCVIMDWFDVYDRNRDFYQEVQCLARTAPVYLFTGIASSPEARVAFGGKEEANYALLSMDGLVGVSARRRPQEQ
jgi:DNA-binding response OmpR family regulator